MGVIQRTTRRYSFKLPVWRLPSDFAVWCGRVSGMYGTAARWCAPPCLLRRSRTRFDSSGAVMTLRSVVCFFAHPDDETILAGGIINMLVRRGVAVHIVCCTRGEGGELGEPPVVERRELLGKAREAELVCAAKALGASLQILGYVDPMIGPDDVLRTFDPAPDTLAQEFLAIARRRQADLILTHGRDGEYGHPAHQAVNYAVFRAFPRVMSQTLIYTVAALVPNIDRKS